MDLFKLAGDSGCCYTCYKQNPIVLDWNPFYFPFIVCSICGNRRCPKATNHDLSCSNSNLPGQKGSRFQDSFGELSKEQEKQQNRYIKLLEADVQGKITLAGRKELEFLRIIVDNFLVGDDEEEEKAYRDQEEYITSLKTRRLDLERVKSKKDFYEFFQKDIV